MRKLTAATVIMGALVLAGELGVSAINPTVLLVDRGLPTGHLNNDAGSLRSNVAWADWEPSIDPTTGYPAEYWLPGDDFAIPLSGKYNITTIRVWVVGDVPDGKKGNPRVTLWGGTSTSGISRISTTYSVTPVSYTDPGISLYQGSSGNYFNINQVDFKVNIVVNGLEAFNFFVDAPWTAYSGGGWVNAFLHASNRLLSVSPQNGADDWFSYLHRTGAITVGIENWNSQTGAGTECAPDSCPGWDKPSDANVQVFGAVQVPGKGHGHRGHGGAWHD
jgi:hypothetical protein